MIEVFAQLQFVYEKTNGSLAVEEEEEEEKGGFVYIALELPNFRPLQDMEITTYSLVPHLQLLLKSLQNFWLLE